MDGRDDPYPGGRANFVNAAASVAKQRKTEANQ
jgi:hypothetical protein